MTTYYVDGVDGSDSNAGTSEGSGNAWATVDKAMNTVAAGDKVWIKDTGTYSETPNIDTTASSTSPIVFEGYLTTTGDNGKVTISGTTNCLTSTPSTLFYVFKNFIFSGSSSSGVNMGATNYALWFNCEFNNTGFYGITCNSFHSFINCVAHGNTLTGIELNQLITAAGNIMYNNGNSQFLAVSGDLFYKNVMYSVANNGTPAASVAGVSAVIGNTIDGENNNVVGIKQQTPTNATAMDNIIYDCVTGHQGNATFYPSQVVNMYNLMNSNSTADYTQNATGLTGLGDVTGAPAFTDEANDDYTLSLASPARQAGLTPGGIT